MARLQFGNCVLDTAGRQLQRDGQEVHVSPKALDLLIHLLDNRPRAVSKQDLMEILWPRTFVSHSSLAVLVAELRRALGDKASHPRYLRTLHRFGYAFCGEALPICDRVTAPAVLIWNDGRVFLNEGENILGRRLFSGLVDPALSISRRHARLVLARAEATLEDCGSKNGTFVRGVRIEQPTRLADGDEIRLGSFSLTFSFVRTDEATQTTPAPMTTGSARTRE